MIIDNQMNFNRIREWKDHAEKNMGPNFSYEDNVLKYKGRLCVPQIDEMIHEILEEAHNTK